MENDLQRQKELHEHFTTTHMLCIVILILGLILSRDMYIQNVYPAINIRLFALLNLIGFGVILLYNAKSRLQKRNTQSLSWINLAYVAFPLLIAAVMLFWARDDLFCIEAILLLPVLIAASVMGKAAGFTMATVCTGLLVVDQIVDGTATSFLQALESGLILISMMYVIGWFIGGLANIEMRHREQLESNISYCKEEIIRRERVEEQLRKLSSAVEQSPSIFMITDTGGTIEYVNHKFSQITGYEPEEVIGKNALHIEEQLREQFMQVWEAVNSGREWRGELLSRKKNGEIYWEYVSVIPFRNTEGAITHFLKVAEDISERKRIEKEMARLDRLNLVGEMAAGIGHEIRNPMTSVRGFLQLLGGKKDCKQYKEYFNIMIEELDRANSIITEYLALAKNKAIDLERNSLNSIVNVLLPLVQADAIKTDKTVKVDLEDIPDLLLDEKEMRQLILNLVRNGLEAMAPGGKLVIKTYIDGEEVVMAVRDEGRGIESDLLEKIGTPFFTTKDQGTGLGLAVCYSIAARHQAEIKVETGTGGTTFYVRFKHPL